MKVTTNLKTMQPYILLEKAVGATPLETLENWRQDKPEFLNVPMAYAGRLDPMASGKLLVLLGEECKKQSEYHSLDKEYVIEALFGVSSDSGDVLGITKENEWPSLPESEEIVTVLDSLVGPIEMPYPIFSSKTVQGKPLHTWTMEGRLGEIVIPSRKSDIYSLTLNSTQALSRAEVHKQATDKIGLLPKVTDPRKALGNDFRRPDVLRSWQEFYDSKIPANSFRVANITCICSSGTYMRTLAEVIAEKLGTTALAFLIHRGKIGTYNQVKNDWSHLF